MRAFRQIALAVTALSSMSLAGCRGRAVPNQVLSKPVPVSVPAPVTRGTSVWLYKPSPERQRFVVDQRAVISIRSDTSVRSDTVSSHVALAFTSAPASGVVTGSIDAFLVQGAGRAGATPPGIATPFAFRADYSTRRTQLDFSSPREAVPCESAPLSVAQSLRDLWFRPPDTLRVGTRWTDSSAYVVCRDGIPLRATVRRSFVVSGTEERGGRTLLTIVRTSRTTIEGAGAQFGEAVGVTGSGSGELAYSFDPATGEVASAAGSATLDLSFRSRLRTQAVRQAVEIRLGRA